MFEQMKWENVYELWRMCGYHFSEVLAEPVSAETVFVEYKQDGYYIYGYDWLEVTEAQERKHLIEKNPAQFLYLTKPTNKGTTQTAEMLMDARNEEEQAAIWIAATTKELSEYSIGRNLGYYPQILHIAACEFLGTRYYLWHHAMKRLVPEILIPSSVLDSIVCKDAKPVVGLVQMNTVLLKSTWSILRYSSLKNGETPKSSCRINLE